VPTIDSTTYRSPNYSTRNAPISCLVLHHGGGTRKSDLDWLCNKASNAGTHYYVCRDGTIYQLVDDVHEAWHAGDSILAGVPDVNEYSLGIETEHKPGATWPGVQLDSLTWLCHRLMAQYDIPTSRVVSHRAVAINPPGRKTDPADSPLGPEPLFRQWVDQLAEPQRGGVERHGLVLTNVNDLNTLEDAVVAGSYTLVKVVTAWGLNEAWTLDTRARLCALTNETIVRTHAGDPSSRKPFPHSEEIPGEIDPWYHIKRHNLLIEIGNEPNNNPYPEVSVTPSGYAYHLHRAIAECRARYPRARLIAPALDIGRENAAEWVKNTDFVAAIRKCDYLGVHAYTYVTFDDKGELAKIQELYAPFRDKPWALTEYGINDKATADATKGQRYASLVRSLKPPYAMATFYHRNENPNPNDPNEAQYAIDINGDWAYGRIWRGGA
jgi:hypothetical protein